MSDDRYALARTLDFGARFARLEQGPVRPRWSPCGRWFWYATRQDAAMRHVVVDVLKGEPAPLFDHAALAAALGPLELRDVEHDAASGITRFAAHGAQWAWHGANGGLQRLGEAFAPTDAPAPDGYAAVRLRGHDLELVTPSSTLRLTDDGEPDHGWGDFSDFVSQLAPVLERRARRPDVIWSPDGRRFATTRVDRRGVPFVELMQSAPADGTAPVRHRLRYPTPRFAESIPQALWVLHTDGRRVRVQLDGLECRGFTTIALGWLRWAADGRSLYVVEGDRAAMRATLWRVDAETGEAVRVVEESGAGIVLPSPSMAEPAVLHPMADGSVLWWSQRSGWGHLHRVHPDGSVQALTRGRWQVRGILHVDEARGRLLFSASGRETDRDPYFVAAYALDLDGGTPRLLTPEPTHHELSPLAFAGDRSGSVAPDGRHFVDVHSTVRQRTQSLLRDADGGPVRRLSHADDDGAWPARLPLPEPFSFEPLDGGEVMSGVLYPPVDFDARRRYAVVEVIYGAPQTIAAPKGWESNRHGTLAEQLAACGFVVVIIDGPGTPYRSHEFQLAAHGHLERCGGLPEHVRAIEALARSRPWMDLGRVGIVGGSGGGYATVRALAAFPHFYRAGVSICGNHDQADYVAMWGERYQGLYDPVLYEAQANAGVVGALRGRLLLVTGDVDDNVDPGQSLRLAEALQAAGRDHELWIVPNAGHMVILQQPVQERVWRFFVDWFYRQASP